MIMATRAEQFARQRAQQAARQHAAARRPRSEPVTETPAEPDGHHFSERTARKAVYALERSPAARPSRKSTRASQNRIKAGSSLKHRHDMQASSPKEQASRDRAVRTRGAQPAAVRRSKPRS